MTRQSATMAKVDLKFVQAFKDRHGRMRHYFRRPGFERVTLPGLPGSAEFMAAYSAAVEDPVKVDHAAGRVQPRSINALMMEYYRSTDFLTLNPSTSRAYRRILDGFRDVHGDKSAVTIEAHHLNAIFHAKSGTPEAAKNLRKRLLKAFSIAVDLGWRKSNPVRDSKAKGKKKVAGHIPWSEDDIIAFETRWAAGTRERLALYLLLFTAVRRSDVVGLGRQRMKAGRIWVVQDKGDVPIWIPIHPTLQAEIDLHPTGMTFLLTQYGRAFTPAGFTKWFVERAKMAGLVRRTPHGLRKAQGRRLAEAEATNKEIAAALGHTSLNEVETYTRSADQLRLADRAIQKQIEAETRTSSVKP